MEIKNAKHMIDRISKEKIAITATIDGQNLTVSLDPDNRHYAEILKQVADGTITIKDAE